jgi:2-desacetyl-2-hydroxyethyl bacteriochlorophyllide A dehydrogenase
MTSHAVVFPCPGQAEVREVPIPPLGEKDVLLEVTHSALSPGTERWCLTGTLATPGEASPEFPHVPGYQAAGVVREVGRAVSGLSAGDRAFSRNCAAPAQWKGSWWGGHVGLHVAPEQAVIRLPSSVSNAQASGLLLAQVGYNGASKPPVTPGDSAVVIGEGLVGLYAAQVLRHRGARVIVSGLQPFRLDLARRFAADEVFDASRGALSDFVRERFPRGVDVVVETASTAATVRLGTELLRNGGHLVLNGFYPPAESLVDWHWLRGKEITVYCPNSRTRGRLEAALALIAGGALRVGELVTHELDLADAPRAYSMLLDRGADFLGVVLRWS